MCTRRCVDVLGPFYKSVVGDEKTKGGGGWGGFWRAMQLTKFAALFKTPLARAFDFLVVEKSQKAKPRPGSLRRRKPQTMGRPKGRETKEEMEKDKRQRLGKKGVTAPITVGVGGRAHVHLSPAAWARSFVFLEWECKGSWLEKVFLFFFQAAAAPVDTLDAVNPAGSFFFIAPSGSTGRPCVSAHSSALPV